MPTEDLILRMRLENGRLVAQEVDHVDQAVGKYEKTAGKAHDTTRKLGGAFGGLRSAVGTAMGITGIGALGIGLGEAVKKATEFQDQQAQLRASLKANHVAGRDAAAGMSEFADSLALRGGFAPPESLQALTQLIRVQHNAKKAQDDLSLATNIARGSHKDLATAVRAVAMVEGGRLGMLTRLGIVLPKHTTATQAMMILHDRYAGSMEAYSHTAAGAMNTFKNTLDILGERIGALLIPAMTAAFTWLGKFVDQIMKGDGAGGKFKDVVMSIWKDGIQPAFGVLRGFIHNIGELIDGFQKGHTAAVLIVAGLAGLVGARLAIEGLTLATKGWAAAQVLLNIAMDANPLGIAVAAVAGLAAAIAVLSAKFPHLWEGLKNGLLASVNWIISKLNWLIRGYNSIVGIVPGADLSVAQIGYAPGTTTTGGPKGAKHYGASDTLPPGVAGWNAGPGAHAPADTLPAGVRPWNAPVPVNRSGAIIHNHISIDGVQVGRVLTRVGQHAKALQ